MQWLIVQELIRPNAVEAEVEAGYFGVDGNLLDTERLLISMDRPSLYFDLHPVSGTARFGVRYRSRTADTEFGAWSETLRSDLADTHIPVVGRPGKPGMPFILTIQE